MEETNESAMDVDSDEASDNTAMKQQFQQKEQDERLNLSEFPIELLQKILINLDDDELLIASHVCKSFAAAVEGALAQKYSKECYYIGNCAAFEKVMMRKYGEKIQTLSLGCQDDELQALIEQKCCSLKSVTMKNNSKMPKLKGLKEINLKGRNLNAATFTELINDNHQLEILDIEGIESGLLNILDRQLNMLKSLTLYDVDNFITDLPKIKLKSLEKLSIMDTKDFVRLLQTMNCNAIKELNMECYSSSSNNDDIIHEICLIKTLVSLQLPEFDPINLITEDQLKKLAKHLPQLTDLHIEITNIEPNPANSIHSVLTILPKLTKLTIELNDDDYKQLLNYLKMSIHEFHRSFAQTNTEIEVINFFSRISISKNRIIISNNYTGYFTTFELHWMNNLNESSLREAIKSFWNDANNIKIVNNCADQTLDIAVFMHFNLDRTGSLDIKSDGPITVNTNITRRPEFFPSLKKLKIHLDNHSASDFLQRCDKHFCKNIEKLRLNTKYVPGNHEVEQGIDMISALAKFDNLKSLHMNPSSVTFNVHHLFSVCQNLKDLQVRRE